MPKTYHCATCGAAITDAQANVSQRRADGAPPRCKDCITDELTDRQKGDDDGQEYGDPRDYREGRE